MTLRAALYQGGTTSLSGYTFTNAGSTNAKILSSQGVYVDSNFTPSTSPIDGQNAPGDFMAYFVFNTQTNEGVFTQTYYPEFDT